VHIDKTPEEQLLSFTVVSFVYLYISLSTRSRINRLGVFIPTLYASAGFFNMTGYSFQGGRRKKLV
jgi:hypothetical protein